MHCPLLSTCLIPFISACCVWFDWSLTNARTIYNNNNLEYTHTHTYTYTPTLVHCHAALFHIWTRDLFAPNCIQVKIVNGIHNGNESPIRFDFKSHTELNKCYTHTHTHMHIHKIGRQWSSIRYWITYICVLMYMSNWRDVVVVVVVVASLYWFWPLFMELFYLYFIPFKSDFNHKSVRVRLWMWTHCFNLITTNNAYIYLSIVYILWCNWEWDILYKIETRRHITLRQPFVFNVETMVLIQNK